MHHRIKTRWKNNITSYLTRKFKKMSGDQPSLIYEIIAECKTSKARVGRMTLKHGEVDTPVFMPVGTQVSPPNSISRAKLDSPLQGTLKGLLPEQLKKLNLQIMLANTYHLGRRPVGLAFIKI